MNPAQVHLRSPEVELWFARHAVVEPLKAWRRSAGSRAADVAFRAVAADGRLLFRADGKTAMAMAEQAEGVACSLKGMGLAPGAVLRSVCDIALLHVGEWKAAERKFSEGLCLGELAARPAAAGPLGGRSAPGELEALLRHSERRCPQFSNPAGKAIASIVLGMGPGPLAELPQAAGSKLSAVSARFVARSLRHGTFEGALSRQECLALLQVVEGWAAMRGCQLLEVGYEGSAGTFADRARALAYDAISCAELSAELPGGEGGDGYRRWERAVERHGYAAVALDPGILQRIPFDKAKVIAAAAIRRVRATAEDNSAEPLLDVPAFLGVRPPGVIQAMLMRLFPDGVPARRSEAANGQPGMKYSVDHDASEPGSAAPGRTGASRKG